MRYFIVLALLCGFVSTAQAQFPPGPTPPSGGGTGDATAANQTNGSQKTQIVDGSGNVIASVSNSLDVNCTAGCGSITGYATAANQVTGNSTLSAIETALGSPFQAGGAVSVSSSALPTGAATAANQLPVTLTNGALVKGTTAAMTGTSSTLVIAAVSSQRIYVTHMSCNNSSATATLITIQDGNAGTTLATFIAPAGGGDVENGSTPMFWTTSGNALYAADVTTSASVICNASGYSSAN